MNLQETYLSGLTEKVTEIFNSLYCFWERRYNVQHLYLKYCYNSLRFKHSFIADQVWFNNGFIQKITFLICYFKKRAWATPGRGRVHEEGIPTPAKEREIKEWDGESRNAKNRSGFRIIWKEVWKGNGKRRNGKKRSRWMMIGIGMREKERKVNQPLKRNTHSWSWLKSDSLHPATDWDTEVKGVPTKECGNAKVIITRMEKGFDQKSEDRCGRFT